MVPIQQPKVALQHPSWGGVSLELKSPDFTAGGNIPMQFTCEGADISPALSWDAPPAATQSFVLIADDPDAPTSRVAQRTDRTETIGVEIVRWFVAPLRSMASGSSIFCVGE